MTDLAVALGLVLVLEGMLWALAPGLARRMLEQAAETPDRQLAAAGWALALPVVLDKDDGEMVFRRWDRTAPLVHDAIGLRGPPPEAPMVQPDLVITPLLAFQRDGLRLGQGGGYYDRALEALRATKKIFVLGLAYSGQQVENLPHEPHDQRLDAILTEKEYMAVNDMSR